MNLLIKVLFCFLLISCVSPKEHQYEDLSGNPVFLEDFKGKKIILHFWATTCRPCLEEMPVLQEMHDSLKQENFVVLLASDQSTDVIKKYTKNSDLDFTFLRFTGPLHKLNVYVLPTTFLYNSEGEKVDEINGAVKWDDAQIFKNLTSNHL